MSEDQWWFERPTDVNGILALLDRLAVDGQVTRDEAKSKAPRTSNALCEEWRSRRKVVFKWAQAVIKRIDAELADELRWRLSSVGRHWESVHYLEAEMALLHQLRVDMKQRLDEATLLGGVDTQWLLEAGRPFSAWQTVREVLAKATKAVWLSDPYVDLSTLALLRAVPGAADVRLLSDSKQVVKSVSNADWTRWTSERGGTNELRVLSGSQLSHDRFLGVDDSVFVSGASFKDLGKRTSVIVQIESDQVSAATRGAFEEQWSKASSAP